MKKTPLLSTVESVFFLLRIVMILVVVSYFFTGVTVIKPDEIGIVYRFGKIQGRNKADLIKKPGWIYTLPIPIEYVSRIPVKEIREVRVVELEPCMSESDTIDPVTEGYCISGDHNIFKASIVIKYQVTDPVALVTSFVQPFGMIRYLISDVAVSEMTRASGEFSVDEILTRKKEQLSLIISQRLQQRLDDLNCGVSVISLEFSELVPPIQLKRAFEDVTTASIGLKKSVNDAESYKKQMIPTARSEATEKVNDAYAYSADLLARAEGEANAFLQMNYAFEKDRKNVSLELISKTRKNVLTRLKKLVIVPSSDDHGPEIRTFLKCNSVNEYEVFTMEDEY